MYAVYTELSVRGRKESHSKEKEKATLHYSPPDAAARGLALTESPPTSHSSRDFNLPKHTQCRTISSMLRRKEMAKE